MSEEQENKCKLCSGCGKNPANEEHVCPFESEINDDHETLCDCCDECTENCCMEI